LLEYMEAKLAWVFEIDWLEWVFLREASNRRPSEFNMAFVMNSKVEASLASCYLHIKIFMTVGLAYL